MKIKNQNPQWVDIGNIQQLKPMPCPDCGKEVSVNAMNCPHCGRKLKESAVGIPAVVILALIVLGFVGWLLSHF
jgi:predicted amidophosphoribosyltransferase